VLSLGQQNGLLPSHNIFFITEGNSDIRTKISYFKTGGKKKRLPFSESLPKESALFHGISWEVSGGSIYLVLERKLLSFLLGVHNEFP
jgi:hypothetical protein